MSLGTVKSRVWSWSHGLVGLALRVFNHYTPGIQLNLSVDVDPSEISQVG